MFSTIRDLLRISGLSRDTQPLPPQTGRPRDRAGKQRLSAGDRAEDDTLFSIFAIRALLTEEPLPQDLAAALSPGEREAILDGLKRLEAQGIDTIPLRLNQSILEAVRAALPPEG